MRLAVAVAALGFAPSAGAVAPANFRTPDGNIGCDMRATLVRCDIVRSEAVRPPRPSGCRFDWGNAVSVAVRGRGRLVCVSDSVMPPAGPAHTVRFGTTVYRNGFMCIVARSGVRCTAPSQHGFFVSKRRYRLF